jgi:hypothetical protein
MYFRGTFTDEAKARDKAARIGGEVQPWRKRTKNGMQMMYTVKTATQES